MKGRAKQPQPKKADFLPIPELSAKERERFNRFIDRRPGLGPTGECWLWTGTVTSRGYPTISLKGRTFRATRVALFLEAGIDPGERLACHRCDCPPCVRGSHLWPGSAAENHADMMAKGRWKPPQKGARVDGERRTNRNAPDARPGRENHHRPDGTS